MFKNCKKLVYKQGMYHEIMFDKSGMYENLYCQVFTDIRDIKECVHTRTVRISNRIRRSTFKKDREANLKSINYLLKATLKALQG